MPHRTTAIHCSCDPHFLCYPTSTTLRSTIHRLDEQTERMMATTTTTTKQGESENLPRKASPTCFHDPHKSTRNSYCDAGASIFHEKRVVLVQNIYKRRLRLLMPVRARGLLGPLCAVDKKCTTQKHTHTRAHLHSRNTRNRLHRNLSERRQVRASATPTHVSQHHTSSPFFKIANATPYGPDKKKQRTHPRHEGKTSDISHTHPLPLHQG